MARRLAEVAKYAGVSEATVSRVLNQKPGVAKATQELVLTALDVLGYERPTQLRGERARLVGLVLLEHQVSGVIFSGGLYAQAAADHEHYVRLRERGLPAVLVNAAYDDLGFPRISVDVRSAVEQAVQHLRFLGHERLGMVLGAADHVPSARKLAAFQELGGDAELVERGMFSMEGGQAAGSRVLRRGATAAVCASDVFALGVV